MKNVQDEIEANKLAFKKIGQDITSSVFGMFGPPGVALQEVLFFENTRSKALAEINQANLIKALVQKTDSLETALKYLEGKFNNPYSGSLLHRVQKLVIEKANGSINEYYDYLASLVLYISAVDDDDKFVEAEMILTLLDRMSVGAVYLLMSHDSWPTFYQSGVTAVNGRVNDFQNDFVQAYFDSQSQKTPKYLIRLAVSELESNQMIEERYENSASFVGLTDLGVSVMNSLSCHLVKKSDAPG